MFDSSSWILNGAVEGSMTGEYVFDMDGVCRHVFTRCCFSAEAGWIVQSSATPLSVIIIDRVQDNIVPGSCIS